MTRNTAPQNGSSVEQVAQQLGCPDVTEVARAVADHADTVLDCEYDRAVLTVAAFRLAATRGRHGSFDLEAACREFSVEPADVTRAKATLSATLQPPADEGEIRTLRRAVITLREIHAMIEAGRTNAPSRPGSSLEGLDPALASLLEQPLDRIDQATLETHIERLEADLEMARLGTELYALVHPAEEGGCTEQ
ncbi:hypothetical protein [Natronosalvus vescus]|uniref:hypothetical protein n=1 Tax=Natronosalvus vescus TaxID=2953881 RepID=UPI002091065B|nr:hypothetical protein [Natronosalvus vescus]